MNSVVIQTNGTLLYAALMCCHFPFLLLVPSILFHHCDSFPGFSSRSLQKTSNVQKRLFHPSAFYFHFRIGSAFWSVKLEGSTY
ncbi:hypothetical protein B0T09DRAFT_23866 [Sordaria sp. MPI-SDFR-AT-0083]|nr:hypothetical protein B0T09DRAFT_23866 [Sordaria sp. MPI-SDFR-AT-0083]